MSTSIDLSFVSLESESEMDRLAACALASLASRLEDSCEHLRGRALAHAQAEAASAWESAGDYWRRAVLMTDEEVYAAIDADFGDMTLDTSEDVTDVSAASLLADDYEG